MAKLKIGDSLPDLTVDTVQQNKIRLSEIVGGKPTIFMVLRYIGCPICRYDVHLLMQRYGEFKEKGVNVVVVMQSAVETARMDLTGNILPFYLICDPEQVIYKAFDINPAISMEELIGDSLPKLQEKVRRQRLPGLHTEYMKALRNSCLPFSLLAAQ